MKPVIVSDTVLARKVTNNVCLETLELNYGNYAKKNESDLRNISNSLEVKAFNPELPEIESIPELEEEVMTDDKEKDRVYVEEDEEEIAMIEGEKDRVCLDSLDRVEDMLSDEEKALVEGEKNRVYVDRLLSNDDKARIEAILIDEKL